MSLRGNVRFIICDQVITLCLQLDGSDEILDHWLNHKFIKKSEIVEASLTLVDSPQCQNGVSRWPEANTMDLARLLSNWDSLWSHSFNISSGGNT